MLSTTMIRILFFGKLADAQQALTCELPAGVKTVQELAAWLGSNNPMLAQGLGQKGGRIAVNQKMVVGDHSVEDGDEIAFMSPLSGG